MAQVKVGIAVIVKRGSQVLLGLRKGSHGALTWAFVGGHLEFKEDILECAARELLEETGLQAKSLRCGPFSNDIFPDEDKHYLTIFVLAEGISGEAELREPDKCHEWRWFESGALPEPLFLPIQNLLGSGFTI